MNKLSLLIFSLLLISAHAWAADQANQPKQGWQVFRTKGCMNCHKMGQSSEDSIGPDLAKVAGGLNEANLAASMWNHAPQMWEKTSEHAMSYQQMDDQEVANLFSFISFLKFIAEEGDPRQGKTVLDSKSCTACHSLGGRGGRSAPDIAGWSQYVNPLAWLQKMWQHAPRMVQEMRRRGIAWPVFKGAEMVDLIAYIRDLGAKSERLYLKTGDPSNGALLLANKGCNRCHGKVGPGPNLSHTEGAAPTLDQLAGAMWNHAPQMLKLMAAQGIEQPALSLKELSDIVAYIFSVRFAGTSGDPKEGLRVFADKGCQGCHTLPGEEEVQGKKPLKEKVSVPKMARGLWNHGHLMLEAMRQKGISWPNLSGKDMADLIAFFREREGK